MENKPLRPLVFDLDGTLIDSRSDIAAACNHTLEQLGRPRVPVESIAAHVGSGARALLRGVLGDDAAQFDEDRIMRIFQAYYLAHPTDHNRMMPGVTEALALRGARKNAICTNKPAHLTRAVVASLGWSHSFDAVVAPSGNDQVKPHPELLVRVGLLLSVEPSSLIMIGDSPQDVGAARAVGAHAIGVKGGFLPLSRLVDACPDVILESLEELPEYLANNGL